MDAKEVGNVPYFSFHLMTHEASGKIHLEVLRGQNRVAVDVPVSEGPHQMDQIGALADPEKSVIGPLGILGVEIDRKIASVLPELRDPYGVLVVDRTAESTSRVSLTAGDVIRTLNGAPMNSLERLRNALKTAKPGAPIALQIQRDGRLLFLSFRLD
jgi:hypothetical protein